MKVVHLIQSLPNYEIPERYQWDATCGVSLADFGFKFIVDCVHKKSMKLVDPFPLDFDVELFNRRRVVKKVKKFISVDPETFVMGQRYLDKNHLLDLTVNCNPKPTRMYQCGRYYLMADGHHRMALKFVKGQRVYATVRVLG